MNIGKYDDNNFKEAESINIAKSVIEKGHRCRTHFNEMDRTPNFDGSISVLQEMFERLRVEVQIKTIPQKCRLKNGEYHFRCETKIFNCFKYHVSQNPITILFVDTLNKKLYFKLLTKEYVDGLNINTQKTKTIILTEADVYSDNAFLKQVFQFAKVVLTDVDCLVQCQTIKTMIRQVKKRDDESKIFVYKRGKVKGFLTAFRIKSENKRFIPCVIINMKYDGKETGDYALVHIRKDYTQVNRIQKSKEITDADYGNIVYEIAQVFYHDGTHPILYINNINGPVYLFENSTIWHMKSETIEAEWNF